MSSQLSLIMTSLGISVASGYLIFMIIRFLIPKKLMIQAKKQGSEIISESKKQANQIITNRETENAEELNVFKDDLESDIEEQRENLKLYETDLKSQEEILNKRQQRLKNHENKIDKSKAKVSKIKTRYSDTKAEWKSLKNQLELEYERKSGQDSAQLLKNACRDLENEKQIECQRYGKLILDDLSGNIQKESQNKLSALLAKYNPKFPWPKAINTVDIGESSAWLKEFTVQNSPFINLANSLSDVNVEFCSEDHGSYIKLAGGFGIHKEALRLAFVDYMKAHESLQSEEGFKETYKKYLQKLEIAAINLGERACFELGIDAMHPSIKRLVGALNWRTSYRQNQWMHSFEVAKLAGLLAEELGEDEGIAVRCGLLHDIGKTLDYNIEGSHAVISADYADRFGESQYVCDTVLSHHNDIVLDTPMANILKTADTLSGARPGARVNLEAGYQSRLSGIEEAVNSFSGISKIAIMNGGREVHIDVDHGKVSATQLQELTEKISTKISEDVAFPGQIKVLVTRRYEAVAQA